MFLTGIERVLKRAGVKYTIVSGAMTRTAHKGGFREITAQMFHTTETADSSFDRGADAPTLGYVRSGLGYPLYNILYGRSGHAYVVACGTAGHAGKGSGYGMPKDQANFHSIAHSADANSSRYPINAAQLNSMAKVAKAFNDDWPAPLRSVMHGEWAPSRRSDPTKVPGGWSALKKAISAGEWDGSAPSGGTSTASKPAPKKSSSKSVSQMADEIIAGRHGSGHANRQRSLGVNNATYQKVRNLVNQRAGVSTPSSSRPSKSIEAMADEIIAGRHGTGHAARQRSLGVSNSVYQKVRNRVNQKASGGGGGKSISRMADEIIAGKHGNGHANRQRSLGVNNATYAAVRKEVNRRS